MFFEFLNYALIDMSSIYFYIGVLVIVLGMTYISVLLYHHVGFQLYDIYHKHRHMKVNQQQVDHPLSKNETMRAWFVIIFKRVDVNDGKEDAVSSYFNHDFKIRGGQLCQETAYSQSARNTIYM